MEIPFSRGASPLLAPISWILDIFSLQMHPMHIYTHYDASAWLHCIFSTSIDYVQTIIIHICGIVDNGCYC
jgi:hypothetical protein